MFRYKDHISFWIQVLSFSGSILFLVYISIFGQPRSIECRECVEKMIYYQHKADSLEQELNKKSP
ncbi:MAG: hypothetical protein IM607_12505 [Cytophagales bacterium]|jgi:hypothetical protein|nr:hypothetical protein [Cytophagales bacterium]